MSKLTPKVLEIAAEAVSYGVRRAFALSLADVDCLSRTDDIGFIDRDNSGIAVGWLVQERLLTFSKRIIMQMADLAPPSSSTDNTHTD